MTFPANDRYVRRYADPRTRPSNEPFGVYAERATVQTMRRLNAWFDAYEAVEDGGSVVAEAWQVLHPRRERVAGDPGE